MPRLLLCTDMDRTIIPNGHQAEHPLARERFARLCSLPEICLVYVTGRDLALTEQAIVRYQLPLPAYAITDVGTKIYEHREGCWYELFRWRDQIIVDWAGKSHARLKTALADLFELRLQEPDKQKECKLSYYVELSANREALFAGIDERLQRMGVNASLIWSIDELRKTGLLDILPRNATKKHGIEFLASRLGYRYEEILFAGDSGNDLPVMGSAIRSILVANADAATKRDAERLARENNVWDSLYLADSDSFALGGNYAAGVLQGVIHFAPCLARAVELATL